MTSRSSASVRDETLKQLAALSLSEKNRLSDEICRRWISAASIRPKLSGLAVGVYRALPRELELGGIENFLRKEGCLIHYPRMRPGEEKMEFVHVAADGAEWKKGPYGIEQPHDHLEPIDPARLELIFVPGVAFGEAGERVGRGKGYFDRFLPSAPEAVRVALAFDFQLHQTVDQREWDQPMHWILTEKREIQLAPAQSWLKQP